MKTFSSRAAAIVTKQVQSPSTITELATFAGGCFWGIELAFQRIPGVIRTQVGYVGMIYMLTKFQGFGNVGGTKRFPTYEEVCSGSTGHTEAVQITFDKSHLAYGELLTVFWDLIDPTALNRQGNDSGTQVIRLCCCEYKCIP